MFVQIDISGSYIHFDNTTQHKKIGIKIPDLDLVPQTRPRLAVALDYADLIGHSREKALKGVFTSIIAETSNGPFEVVVNEELKIPPVKWIEGASIYVYGSKATPQATINLTVKKVGVTRMNLELSSKNLKILDTVMEKTDKKTLFIEFKFSPDIKTDVFKQYSIDKHWCYQINLDKNKIPVKVAKGYTYSKPVYKHQWGKGLHKVETNPRKMAAYASAYSLQGWDETMIPEGQGLEIQRHTKYGEVPNHKWYSDYMGAEYKFPWGKYETANEDKKKTI